MKHIHGIEPELKTRSLSLPFICNIIGMIIVQDGWWLLMYDLRIYTCAVVQCRRVGVKLEVSIRTLLQLHSAHSPATDGVLWWTVKFVHILLLDCWSSCTHETCCWRDWWLMLLFDSLMPCISISDIIRPFWHDGGYFFIIFFVVVVVASTHVIVSHRKSTVQWFNDWTIRA